MGKTGKALKQTRVTKSTIQIIQIRSNSLDSPCKFQTKLGFILSDGEDSAFSNVDGTDET